MKYDQLSDIEMILSLNNSINSLKARISELVFLKKQIPDEQIHRILDSRIQTIEGTLEKISKNSFDINSKMSTI